LMMMRVTRTGMHLTFSLLFLFKYLEVQSNNMCYSVVNTSFHDKEDRYI